MQAARPSLQQINGNSIEEPIKLDETSPKESIDVAAEDVVPSDASIDNIDEVPTVDSPEPTDATTSKFLRCSYQHNENSPICMLLLLKITKLATKIASSGDRIMIVPGVQLLKNILTLNH